MLFEGWHRKGFLSVTAVSELRRSHRERRPTCWCSIFAKSELSHLIDDVLEPLELVGNPRQRTAREVAVVARPGNTSTMAG